MVTVKLSSRHWGVVFAFGVLLGVLLGLLGGCARPEIGLSLVDDREAWPRLVDGGSLASLERAASGSMAYYRRQPPEARFAYGGVATYTAAELVASLEHFLRLYRQHRDAGELQEALYRDFYLFESRGTGEGLFTGYYEPLLQGRVDAPSPAHPAPIFARPRDLIAVDLDRFGVAERRKRRLVGRVVDQHLEPYFSRRQIEREQALRGSASVLAYVDPIDLFFMQIQGSGVVVLPDRSELRLGYDGTNGHPYRSIGALLVEQGDLPLATVTMQSIRRWLRNHPHRVEGVLHANPSYVFFRRLHGAGPLGNIQVPLTPRRSLALDRSLFVPGGLAYVKTTVPYLRGTPDRQAEEGDSSEAIPERPWERFMLVQDTGGAIRGHARGDIFWGRGAQAAAIAGRLKHPGKLYLLVARKAVLEERLQAQRGSSSATVSSEGLQEELRVAAAAIR